MVLKDDINDIKIAVARIEQHLSDINGTIQKHDRFLSSDCPKQHQSLRDMVIRNTALIVAGGVIINAIVYLIIKGW